MLHVGISVTKNDPLVTEAIQIRNEKVILPQIAFEVYDKQQQMDTVAEGNLRQQQSNTDECDRQPAQGISGCQGFCVAEKNPTIMTNLRKANERAL